MKQFYTGLSVFFLLLTVVLAWLVFSNLAGFNQYLASNFDEYVTQDAKLSDQLQGITWMVAGCLAALFLALAAMTLRNFAKVPVVELAEADIKKIEKAAEDANQEATEQERKEQERLKKLQKEQQAQATQKKEKLLQFQPKGNTMTLRAESWLRELANGFNAGQGIFYLRSQKEQLALAATYAYIVEDGQTQEVSYGSGFVGETARKQVRLVLEEIPENYLQIFSGLGSAVPNFLVFQPIVHQQEVCGVIELALFGELNTFELEALQTVADHIGKSLYPEVKDRFSIASPVSEPNPTTAP